MTTSVWLEGTEPYSPRPPLRGKQAADVAVIGGGLTGVQTALELSRRVPDRRVVLLEARTLASGASGRNGGLVLHVIPGVYPPAEIAAVHRAAVASAVDGIEETIRELRLAVELRRDGLLTAIVDPVRAEVAAARAEALAKAGVNVQFVSGKELAAKIDVQGAYGAIFDPRAARLDSARYVRALREPLVARGVEVHEETPVLSVREGATVVLSTPEGELAAPVVVLATSGYTPRLGYFRNGIVPLHAHVIATEPLSPARWEEAGWHEGAGFSDDMGRLSYGSRTADGRLVFGGGSNAAYHYRFGGATELAGDGARAAGAIERTLRSYLPVLGEARITHRWSGLLDVTLSRACAVGVTGEHDNIHYGLGYSGCGIALSALSARMIADTIAGDGERWREIPIYGRRPEWIPPEPFRWAGYKFYTSFTGRSPRSEFKR
jgi:glycine/D-amino acid oxidase-like deaminating enzyme